ncbi:HAGHL protein, partial [Calcarius ornatus]|nr:HAGHL protein [Calcarius ornatus]
MKVKVISVLEDNYMYLVIEESTRHALAVDAAVPKRVSGSRGRKLIPIPACLGLCWRVSPSPGSQMPSEQTQLDPTQSPFRSAGLQAGVGRSWGSVCPPQEDPDPLSPQFGTIRVKCLFTPCHTSGHMCYFMWEDDSPDAPALFSGDTLFVGGCGQFFEGTAEQMHTNLTQILGTLPKDTGCPCREEAPGLCPQGSQGCPCREEAVQRFTGRTEPVEVLRALRSHRDNFKKPKERPHPQAVLAFDWGLFGPFLEKK